MNVMAASSSAIVSSGVNQSSEMAEDEYAVLRFNRFGAVLLWPVPVCEMQTIAFPLVVPATFRTQWVTWSAAVEPPAATAEKSEPPPVDVPK
jgi:hypothetical protein